MQIPTWVALVEESYSITGQGAIFQGWPDGQPLLEQEQVVVDSFKVVLTEILKEISDGKKKHN